MSEEQILALAAENSPEVAKAFQEKFQGLSAEQQAEMYERMLEDRDAAKDQLAEALQESAQMQQETAFKAMETQRDISVAYAESGSETPVVVTPGMGMGTAATPTGGTGRAIVCPRCHLESPVGIKYCQNCGYEFFGQEEGGQ
jgi:acyl-CoA reductase-like NAD-dependent aldehyde dehydrogenase